MLRRERLRDEPRDEAPDRALGEARVDAGVAGLGAPLAEAGRADQAERAAHRHEQRTAGVALARVGAAAWIAGAKHRRGIEGAVVGRLAETVRIRLRAVGIGGDRDARAYRICVGGVEELSDVVPNPAIVAGTPGRQLERSLTAAISIGRIREGWSSCRSVTSLPVPLVAM